MKIRETKPVSPPLTKGDAIIIQIPTRALRSSTKSWQREDEIGIQLAWAMPHTLPGISYRASLQQWATRGLRTSP